MAPEPRTPEARPATAKDADQAAARAADPPRAEPPARGDGVADGSVGSQAAGGVDATQKDAAGADAPATDAGGGGDGGAAAAAAPAAVDGAATDAGRVESDRPRKRQKSDHPPAEAPSPSGAASEVQVDETSTPPPACITDVPEPKTPVADSHVAMDAKEPPPRAAADAAPAVAADPPTEPDSPEVAASVADCPAGDAQWASLLASNAAFVAHGWRPTLAGSSVSSHREALASGQSPSAVVVACSDSRVSPELLFARGLGELFVIRTAGNTAAYASTVASVEYAVHNLGAPLVVVLGHTGCGAVAAAVATAADAGAMASQPSTLATFVKSTLLAPVRAVWARGQGVVDTDFVAACEAENVATAVRSLVTKSTWMRKARARGKVKVVGAMYNVAAGTVKEV